MLLRIFLFAYCIILMMSLSLSLTPSGSRSAAAEPTLYAATVKLGETNQNKQAIYASNDSVTITVTVVTSADVPTDGTASAKVDLIEFSNSGNISYSVTPASQTQTKTLAGGGEATNFSFTITTTGQNTKTGTINSRFSLASAVGATVTMPTTIDLSIVVQSQTAQSDGLKPFGANCSYSPDGVTCLVSPLYDRVWVEQQREELAAHHFAAGDHRHAFEQRRICS
jgi:hypothetical protein